MATQPEPAAPVICAAHMMAWPCPEQEWSADCAPHCDDEQCDSWQGYQERQRQHRIWLENASTHAGGELP